MTSAAVQRKARVANPWKKRLFPNITVNVGVWTTERNKLAAIQTLYTILFDGRLFYAPNGVVVGEVYRPAARDPTFAAMRDTLATQLKSFRDTPSGKVCPLYSPFWFTRTCF